MEVSTKKLSWFILAFPSLRPASVAHPTLPSLSSAPSRPINPLAGVGDCSGLGLCTTVKTPFCGADSGDFFATDVAFIGVPVAVEEVVGYAGDAVDVDAG